MKGEYLDLATHHGHQNAYGVYQAKVREYIAEAPAGANKAFEPGMTRMHGSRTMFTDPGHRTTSGARPESGFALFNDKHVPESSPKPVFSADGTYFQIHHLYIV